MDTVEIIPIGIQEKVKAEVAKLLGGATIEKIENPQQLVNANDLLKTIKVSRKIIDQGRKDLKDPITKKGKAIEDYFREPLASADKLEGNLKYVMVTYERICEAKRVDDQKKRDEIARKERFRIEEQARKQRHKEDALRQEADDKRREAQKTKDDKERKRLEAEAKKAENKAKIVSDKADLKEHLAENVVSSYVPSEAPKLKGFSSSVKWKVKCVSDMKTFVKHCLDNNELEYLLIDEGGINRVAQAKRGTLNLPGIEIEQTTVGSSRKDKRNG